MRPDYDEMLYRFLVEHDLQQAWITARDVIDNDKRLAGSLASYCSRNIRHSCRKRVRITDKKSERVHGQKVNHYRIVLIQ